MCCSKCHAQRPEVIEVGRVNGGFHPFPSGYHGRKVGRKIALCDWFKPKAPTRRNKASVWAACRVGTSFH